MAKEKLFIKVENSELKELIEKYKQKHDESGLIKKESDSFSKSIKKIAEKQWMDYYKETGENPGTIVIEAQDDIDGSFASITYIPSNRFKSITDKNLDSIKDIIGDEFLDNKIEHVITNDIYTKYQDLITDFILNNDNIEDKDKINFIKKTEKVSIKKETLDNLTGFDDVQKVLEAISPVFSIKDPIIS
jgi:hypothetical protein|tara:strand:- start:1775 stop:2341 length:567 start_codon:yes stop_codon:yes gene_type:complete